MKITNSKKVVQASFYWWNKWNFPLLKNRVPPLFTFRTSNSNTFEAQKWNFSKYNFQIPLIFGAKKEHWDPYNFRILGPGVVINDFLGTGSGVISTQAQPRTYLSFSNKVGADSKIDIRIERAGLVLAKFSLHGIRFFT